MSFDHLQMPAMADKISNRVGMTALCGLFRILLCFEFVPHSNLLFFTFVFVLPRPPPFLARLRVTELDIFFFGRKIFVRYLVWHTGVFCRTFGQNVPIVRRISTALWRPPRNLWGFFLYFGKGPGPFKWGKEWKFVKFQSQCKILRNLTFFHDLDLTSERQNQNLQLLPLSVLTDK